MIPRKAIRSTPPDAVDGSGFTFTTAGTFPHHRRLHPHIVGKVVIRP
ncbi:MAG TPA: hypothetical protein VKU90_14465 [Caulobacteraceae bacterium]|jgi:hypothetical protein|nr:hypothetical protein [Caulobacteraceae bacterium]